MGEEQYIIKGVVVLRTTGTPLASVRVEAWDRDLFFDDFVGGAQSDAEGRFRIVFKEERFKELIQRGPDLYFKLFQFDEPIAAEQIELEVTLPDGTVLAGTGDQVFWKLAPGETRVEIKLDLPPGEVMYSVRGRVTEPDGSPIVGVKVKAYDRIFSQNTPLGEATTDDRGRYLIHYPAASFLNQGKQSPDLDIHAYDAQGERIAWLPDPPLYNARQSEEINLVWKAQAYQGPSEYQRFLETITPLLGQNSIGDLTEEDIDFLAGKTQIDVRYVAWLVIAARFAKAVTEKLPDHQLPPEVFYGLFRHDVPAVWSALLVQNAKVLRRALAAAVQQNTVFVSVADLIEPTLQVLQLLRVEEAFEPPPETGKFSLGDLLSTASDSGGQPISEQQMRQFVQRFVGRTGSLAQFWAELAEDAEFQELSADLQLTLQLGVLTWNHLPLVQKLKQPGANRASVGSLRDLARHNVEGWKALMYELVAEGSPATPPDVAGEDEETRIGNYARTITLMIEDALPTESIAYQLASDPEPPLSCAQDVSGFLLSHPDFAFGGPHIDQQLKGQPAHLIRAIKMLDRLYRVTPRFDRYEAMRALMSSGFDSALRIARFGINNFVSRFGGTLGYTKARAIFANAHFKASTAVALFAKYSPATNQPSLPVLPHLPEGNGDAWEDAAQVDVPDWATLFGTPSQCTCEHCRSVLSPAAYLVDLLKYLKDHNLQCVDGDGTTEIQSALSVLSARRPDIRKLELSCENAKTPLPYIDLVNEVLEYTATNGLDDPSFPDATNGAAADLSVNPEHLNVAAYEKLAQEFYPWSLSFDLWAESARVYLNHLGVPRWKLMLAFQGKGEPDPDELTIATEYLGLTQNQRVAITSPAVLTQWYAWEFWGFTAEQSNNDYWYEHLADPACFFEKSKLSFVELSRLLDTRYINPGRFAPADDDIQEIYVELDEDCQPIRIHGLHESALDRLHRFVRLLRALGWDPVEADKVITMLWRLRMGNDTLPIELDDGMLQQLAHVHNLHAELKVPLQQMLAWWSKIDTERRDHDDSSLYEELFLNRSVLLLPPEEGGAASNQEVYKAFKLNAGRDELASYDPANGTFAKITSHALNVLAAVKIPDADLSRLLERTLLFQLDRDNALEDALDQGKIPTQLRRLFQQSHVSLSGRATVSRIDVQWLITDGSRTFTISITTSILPGKLLAYAHDVPDILNLGNLSHLYRIVTFTKALQLTIEDFLELKKLTGLDPFEPQAPRETRRFVDRAEKLRRCGFNIAEQSYLVRHAYGEAEGIAPATQQIALVLTKIRDDARRIANEHEFAADPSGDVTRGKLAILLSEEQTNQAMQIMSGCLLFTFAADGDYHLEDDHVSPQIREKFAANAITLSDQAMLFVIEQDRAWCIDDVTVDNRPVKYFITLQGLEANKTEYFVNGEPPPFWESFIRDYLAFPADGATGEGASNGFLDFEEAKPRLCECPSVDYLNTREQRIDYVLRALLEFLRRSASENLVIRELSSAQRLETASCEQLLRRYVVAPDQPSDPCIAVFLEEAFLVHDEDGADADEDDEVTPERFPAQFRAFLLLHKIATIALRLDIGSTDIELLFQRDAESWGTHGWLDLNDLPLSVQEGASTLSASLEMLTDLIAFGESLLPGDPPLLDILRMAFVPSSFEPPATKSAFFAALTQRTGWNLADLEELHDKLGFDFPDDYRQVETLTKLTMCFQILQRLGVSAAHVRPWCEPNPSAAEANENARRIKQAAKAKYDQHRWIAVAAPLQDVLREQQRAALVSYLVSNPNQLAPLGTSAFRDANDLYDFLLLDVEMSPRMITSRMKLAISSVQLFIQRLLQNLEHWRIPSANEALEWRSHWSWMKNYRVWEANRKIFLYPENWIEPELRDDKTPFFRDLENGLLQDEVTAETAERAFLSYLEKLDDVANLEICGSCREQESEAPSGAGAMTTDILHVFGRSRGNPHVYYHRQRSGATGPWTPWERVDAGIEGDHLIPVVWNRRLHLFWPIFEEQSEEAVVNNPNSSTQKKAKRWWKIQLAHSEYRNGKWTAKKVLGDGQAALDEERSDAYGYQAKHAYVFKVIVEDGQLTILCYRCPDQAKAGVAEENPKEAGQASSADADIPDYDEWSVPDGHVVRGSRVAVGRSRPVTSGGAGSKARIIGAFRYTGCDRESSVIKGRPPITLLPGHIFAPLGSRMKCMTLTQDRNDQSQTDDEQSFNLYQCDIYYAAPILNVTPSAFQVLYPNWHPQFTSQDIFCYQDDDRTFLVTPKAGLCQYIVDLQSPESEAENWQCPSEVRPGYVDNVYDHYWHVDRMLGFLEQFTQPPDDIDPGIHEESFGVDWATGGIVDYDQFWHVAGRLTDRVVRSTGAKRAWTTTAATAADDDIGIQYLFESFDHSYVCQLIKHLNREGIEGVLQRPVQLLGQFLFHVRHQGGLDEDESVPSYLQQAFAEVGRQLSANAHIELPAEPEEDKWLIVDEDATYVASKTGDWLRVRLDDGRLFEDVYEPVPGLVTTPYPTLNMEFRGGRAYSLYNWELFFHVPLIIADRLRKNQQFAQAQKWFHFIFDPTDVSLHPAPQRFWKTRPFFEDAKGESIQELIRLLDQDAEAANSVTEQVQMWQDYPFSPHRIARLRIAAYQKTVIMKYIDNLLAWGDQLFRRDTIESINEATQLYIMAAKILGDRPAMIEANTQVSTRTFDDLEGELDAFSNAFVQIENALPSRVHFRPWPLYAMAENALAELGPSLWLTYSDGLRGSDGERLYFCVPRNERLLSYWDIVADRLFKIRHCMTIEGVVRQLPLFEPPIEPGLLVRAVAAGVDISSAVNDVQAGLPHFRFPVMLQKAVDFCRDVQSLGAALLAALEKKDADQLALLRSSHEHNLLMAARQIKEKEVEETRYSLAALQDAGQLATLRQKHFARLIKRGLSSGERAHLLSMAISLVAQTAGQFFELAASGASHAPDFYTGAAGFGGSPVAVTHLTGGSKAGSALHALASYSTLIASMHNQLGAMRSVSAGFERRSQDWKLQESLAAKEIEQIDHQITAAQTRLEIAQRALRNHDLAIENAGEVRDFLRDKFTNRELYDWMVTQISTVYFQTYQMAYDLAKQTEKAFQHETGDYERSFVQFGYWDSLKKGLLSGERLHFDLRRMEAAYLEKNKRDYEITKHVSLAMLDPLALVTLKETQECFVNLPEVLFDLDYPGHYMRRIKSVSLTIPCVTGPYSGVNCTLTLLKNEIRVSPDLINGEYVRSTDGEDRRFRDNVGAIQSIVTSSAQSDSGMFETNLRDERYLPFEGAGAISEWRLHLPKACQQFDYATISDVVLHVSYTAKDGGDGLREAVEAGISTALIDYVKTDGLGRLLSLNREFAGVWGKSVTPSGTTPVGEFELTREHFPYFLSDMDLSLTEMRVYLRPKRGEEINTSGLTLSIVGTGQDGATYSGECTDWCSFDGQHASHGPMQEALVDGAGDSGPVKRWTITVTSGHLSKDTLDDVLILIKYKTAAPA